MLSFKTVLETAYIGSTQQGSILTFRTELHVYNRYNIFEHPISNKNFRLASIR